jgi:hypothetical protein
MLECQAMIEPQGKSAASNDLSPFDIPALSMPTGPG